MKPTLVFSAILIVFFTSTSSITAQNKTDKAVSNLIEKKRAYNKKNGYGFRIQLYYGAEERAKKELIAFRENFPDMSTHIHYFEPWWKSQVGDFKSRLEADRALLKIKKEFPSAIVVPR